MIGVYTEICAATNDRDGCLDFLKRIEDTKVTYDELADKGAFGEILGNVTSALIKLAAGDPSAGER